MSRLLFTSRDLASLRVAERRSRRTGPIVSPRPAARGERSRLLQLLRRCWNWIEQPEAQAPASRPLCVHFYTEL